MLPSVRAIASRALVTASATILALSALPAAATSLGELIDLNLRAWGGERELLGEVYAPEGVHTATYFDRTDTYLGPDEIARVGRPRQRRAHRAAG